MARKRRWAPDSWRFFANGLCGHIWTCVGGYFASAGTPRKFKTWIRRPFKSRTQAEQAIERWLARHTPRRPQ